MININLFELKKYIDLIIFYNIFNSHQLKKSIFSNFIIVTYYIEKKGRRPIWGIPKLEKYLI